MERCGGRWIYRPDAFDVCWCAGQCDDSEGSYSPVADGLIVLGPTHPAREELQIVANPFRLKFSVKLPRDTDRFSIIPSGVENVACGSDAALSYGSTFSATSAPYADVEDELETWVDTVVHEVGSYHVCWCGRLSCSRAVHYNIVAIYLIVGGPTTSSFSTMEAGWPLSLGVYGIALGADDRISIVPPGVQCGTDAATILADTVDHSNSEADGLGSPHVIDPTYVVWSGFTIKSPGTYTICWVGNYSDSSRCVEPTSATECGRYVSTNFPYTLATLFVDYGRVTMYGEADIDTCSGLWIDALPPGYAATQLEWTCAPVSSSMCNHVMAVSDSLEYSGAQEWQDGLYASVPASVLRSGLGDSNQESFELTVTLLDPGNVTRRGSTTITVFSGLPLVTSRESEVEATVGGSFRLEVYVRPPPAADCTATPPDGLNVSVVWFRRAPGGIEFPALASQGSIISEIDWISYLAFDSPAVAALGVGTHTIEAHVSAAGAGGLAVTRAMTFEVRVVTVASPVAVLAAPDIAAVGCPLVLDASGSYDPVELSASVSYRWGCFPVGAAACPDLEAFGGAFQSVRLGADSVGQLTFRVTVLSSTGSRQSSAGRTIQVQANTTSGPGEGIGTLAVPPTLAVGGQLECAASMSPECGPSGEIAWVLVRAEASGLAAIEEALDTREVSVVDLPASAAAPVVMFVSTVPSSMLIAGGQYRCVLRSEGQELQSTGAFALADAPWNGQVILSPQEGTALQTDFLLVAEGWVSHVADALPLEYAFVVLNVSSEEGSSLDQPAYIRGYGQDNPCIADWASRAWPPWRPW
ncbi:unnamed protein product [Prorocentrum cordatum]|uniref:Uncharacterized protein n=1 Tax=Prorocentrum cordatum TaxID=2364126 RepID=A0ABN9UJY3_9DINO|nr:unnamed protein product [Polarella glacialis]